jgi:formylglycine-generating enzyme required for sulfatase activity
MRKVGVLFLMMWLSGCVLPGIPMGEHNTGSSSRVRAGEAENASLEHDRQLLQLAEQTGSEESFQTYLDRCMACADQASVMLQLAILQEERIQRERQDAIQKEQERKFWAWTEQVDKIHAYQNYLDQCTVCEFREEAERCVKSPSSRADSGEGKSEQENDSLRLSQSSQRPPLASDSSDGAEEGSDEAKRDEAKRDEDTRDEDTPKRQAQESVEPSPASVLAASAEKEMPPRAPHADRFVPSRDEKEWIDELLTESVWIPAGKFMMGHSERKEESPVHEVSVAAFKMMAWPVTNALWQACVHSGGCSSVEIPFTHDWESKPVMGVSYEDITREFIPWLTQKSGRSFRLPSEAEWEYAARAGVTSEYYWGDSHNCLFARYGRRRGGECSSTEDGPSPVKSFDANAFGLYDMLGNVWEWVEDCWNPDYQGAPVDGSAWKEGECERGVMRGGSWYSVPHLVRLSARTRGLRTYRLFNGFRLVVEE